MKTKQILFIGLIFWQLQAIAQTREVSGRVIDEQGSPVAYANIWLENSVEGTSSDNEGFFRFNSHATGEGCLIVSMIGYHYNNTPNNAGIYERKPILLEQPQNFYVGFFLTLGRNVAYEATHF